MRRISKAIRWYSTRRRSQSECQCALRSRRGGIVLINAPLLYYMVEACTLFITANANVPICEQETGLHYKIHFASLKRMIYGIMDCGLINDPLYTRYNLGAHFIPRSFALLSQGIMFIDDLTSYEDRRGAIAMSVFSRYDRMKGLATLLKSFQTIVD